MYHRQNLVDPEAETEIVIPPQKNSDDSSSCSSVYYSALSDLDESSSSEDEDLEINPDVDVAVERTNPNINANRPYWELSTGNYDSSAGETSAGVSHCILVNSRLIHFPSNRPKLQQDE